jgi:hypothetical protein
MTRRDNITRWRAKGLWTGGAVTDDPLDCQQWLQGPRVALARRISQSEQGSTKVAVDFSFEAVLGKTHRTEF